MTNMYILIRLSTPYDISTKSGTTSTHSQTDSYYKPNVKIAKWSTDGTKLYTVNDNHGNVCCIAVI